MLMLSKELIELAKIGAPFLLGGGGVWAYLSARQAAHNPATIAVSQAAMAEALTAQTKELLKDSALDRHDLKRRVDRLGKNVNHLSKEVNECNTRHANCEDSLAAVKAQIDAVMAGSPAPDYTEFARRRDATD